MEHILISPTVTNFATLQHWWPLFKTCSLDMLNDCCMEFQQGSLDSNRLQLLGLFDTLFMQRQAQDLPQLASTGLCMITILGIIFAWRHPLGCPVWCIFYAKNVDVALVQFRMKRCYKLWLICMTPTHCTCGREMSYGDERLKDREV
jgi:hypothetical protein